MCVAGCLEVHLCSFLHLQTNQSPASRSTSDHTQPARAASSTFTQGENLARKSSGATLGYFYWHVCPAGSIVFSSCHLRSPTKYRPSERLQALDLKEYRHFSGAWELDDRDLVGDSFSQKRFLSSPYFLNIRLDQVSCAEALKGVYIQLLSGMAFLCRDLDLSAIEHSCGSGQEDQMPTFCLPAEPCCSLRRKRGDSEVAICVRS